MREPKRDRRSWRLAVAGSTNRGAQFSRANETGWRNVQETERNKEGPNRAMHTTDPANLRPVFVMLTAVVCTPTTTWAWPTPSGPSQPTSVQPPTSVLHIRSAKQAAPLYQWPRLRSDYESLARRIRPPNKFQRIPEARGSYAYWLRHLPLLPANTPVRAYDGSIVQPGNAPLVAAVVDLDVGNRNLQQCWDSLVRIRAEYLWSRKAYQAISFPYGGRIRFLSWSKWRQGWRPRGRGRHRMLRRVAHADGSRRSFRRYLIHLFRYTGTIHAYLTQKVRPDQARPGDFFIESGSPGHAVLILDMAKDAAGHRRVLIGQGFMPAQNFHVLRNAKGAPWFHLDPKTGGITLPMWPGFQWKRLRRFRNQKAP